MRYHTLGALITLAFFPECALWTFGRLMSFGAIYMFGVLFANGAIYILGFLYGHGALFHSGGFVLRRYCLLDF